MKPTILTIATALALGALVGCDRNPEQRPAGTGSSQARTATPPATPPADTSNTPANIGQASQTEKKDGANPVQGQVDPKQGEQHKDFQQRGDGTGPRGPDTQPKTGG
jgi:hypothetical protein